MNSYRGARALGNAYSHWNIGLFPFQRLSHLKVDEKRFPRRIIDISGRICMFALTQLRIIDSSCAAKRYNFVCCPASNVTSREIEFFDIMCPKSFSLLLQQHFLKYIDRSALLFRGKSPHRCLIVKAARSFDESDGEKRFSARSFYRKENAEERRRAVGHNLLTTFYGGTTRARHSRRKCGFKRRS